MNFNLLKEDNPINKVLLRFYNEIEDKPETISELTDRWIVNKYPLIDKIPLIKVYSSKVMPVLETEGSDLHSIVRKCKLTIPETSAALCYLIKKRIVKHFEGKYYLI